MRNFVAAIIMGSLALAGTGSAVAQSQSPSPPHADAAMQPARGASATSDRESYMQTVHSDMRSWEQRLHTFGGTTDARLREADNAAARDLKAAWTTTQTASRKLERVSAGGWQEAKAAYERATRDLSGAWHRIHPENT